jgi:hypothetical protein
LAASILGNGFLVKWYCRQSNSRLGSVIDVVFWSGFRIEAMANRKFPDLH